MKHNGDILTELLISKCRGLKTSPHLEAHYTWCSSRVSPGTCSA